MKINFEDKSYLEVKNSEKDGYVTIIIQAKDFENPLKKITNIVEITKQQFDEIIKELK